MNHFRRIFPWVLLSLPAGSDDIILTTGEVVEGRIDEAATAAANRGSTDPSKNRLVVTVDAEGTRRLLNLSDVKYVISKKTSWELRKEAEEWYARQKPRDTLASHESLARQCRARRLDLEAEKHFQRACELKKAEGADPTQLAQWCRKNGLMAAEREAWRTALTAKKSQSNLDSFKECLDLAEWCRKTGLVEDAIELFERAAKLDVNHPVPTRALTELRNGAEIRLKKLAEEYEKAGRAWEITVAIEDDVTTSFLEEWKKKIESLSRFIFEVTEGQFYLAGVKIEDRSSNGRIVVDRGKKDWLSMEKKEASGVLAYCKYPGKPNWEVHCPGKTWESVLCHELFHGILNLRDEYYQNPQCPCIMRAAPNPQKICNAQTHLKGGEQVEACWTSIKRRYPDVVSPNPAWKYTQVNLKPSHRYGAEEVDGELTWREMTLNSPPPTRIVVIDN
jgi:tetratricopeptide (TPR) repeat protein